jgi:ribosomal protein S18 acetylase RimI-like enzyme
MVVLDRPAITSHLRGLGYGRDLMIDAITHGVAAGEYAAAKFVAVDPIDLSARRFYEAFGSRAIPGDDLRRMYVRIDEALSALSRGLSDGVAP